MPLEINSARARAVVEAAYERGGYLSYVPLSEVSDERVVRDARELVGIARAVLRRRAESDDVREGSAGICRAVLEAYERPLDTPSREEAIRELLAQGDLT